MTWSDPEVRRTYHREWMRRRLSDPLARYRHRAQCRIAVAKIRRRFVADGLTTKGKPPQPRSRLVRVCYTEGALAYSRSVSRWLIGDVGTCGRWWHEAQGKPWNWRGYSDSEAWRVRYAGDEQFRAREIFKVQTLKAARAYRIAKTCDGSITAQSIQQLFAEAKFCPYCMESMGSMDKSLDHVEPLLTGGAHSLDNALICCKPCNYSKGRKRLIHWLLCNPKGTPEHPSHG